MNFKCKPENTIKLPPHAMDYFFFKTGTWWVYECEQTGYRDSLYVKSSFIKVLEAESAKRDCGCGYGKCFEFGGININSQRGDSLNKGEMLGYIFNHYDLGSFDKNPLYGTSEIKEDFEGCSDLPGYKMDYRENTFINPSDNGGTLKKIDSMMVKGNVFQKILENSYPGGAGYPDWYQIAWYGKNMHLVKYIKTDGTVWNLVKWNIVQ